MLKSRLCVPIKPVLSSCHGCSVKCPMNMTILLPVLTVNNKRASWSSSPWCSFTRLGSLGPRPYARTLGRIRLPEQVVQVTEGGLERNHIGIFGLHVEEVDLVRGLSPIEHTLLHDHHLEVVGECVHDGGPHAAAGGGACDQEGVHLELVQITHEGGAEEDARLVFEDDDVAVLRRYLAHDLVTVLGLAVKVLGAAAVLAVPSTSRQGGLTGWSGAVKDRNSRSPGRIQQPADLLHTLPAFLTTAVAAF